MKAMVIARVHSGLSAGVIAGRWQPSGSPAVYRLIESLDAAGELRLVLGWKGEREGPARDSTVTLTGLRTPVTVLAGPVSLPGWLRSWRSALGELRHVWKTWRMVRRERPNVVHVDRGNLWTAAILARWSDVPVVYRMLGMSEELCAAYGGQRPRDRINRWMLRAPFAAVVCTEDGSGGRQWLARLLRPGVSQHHLLNGVARSAEGDSEWLVEARRAIPSGRIVVLCAGRLEQIKGCDDFLEAFLEARAQAPGALHAVFVGAGERESALRQRVTGARADADVLFLGAVPHRQVHAVYRRADVYVSLNRMGSLSNTTLEALAYGCCVVLPTSDPRTFRDLSTEDILPEGTVVRFGTIDDRAKLAATLLRLAKDPASRSKVASAGQAVAAHLLTSWDDRIAWEVSLLHDLSRTRAAPARMREVRP